MLVAYGDWSRTAQMRHFVPTKGIGMRRLISRHFETVSINEFRTSKVCCNCAKELSHVKIKQEESKNPWDDRATNQSTQCNSQCTIGCTAS